MATASTYRRTGGRIQYAADFIRAAGITNTTQRQALQQLEIDLVAAGLLDKYDRRKCRIKAMYPLVGGNALAHSFNFVNPARYQITWYGSPTHNANGVQFNGLGQYGDTNMPGNVLDSHDTHLGYYADQAIADENRGGQGVMGAAVSSDKDFLLSYNRGSISLYVSAQDNALVAYSQPGPLAGLMLGTRTNATDARLYYQGSQVAISTATDSSTLSAQTISIGGAQGGSTTSIVPCSFATVGQGLSSTQQLAYYQAIQRFQTSLNRAR